MTTKTPDFTKVMQDMMASMPMDAAAFQNAFRNHAAMAEKFSKVALEAAEKSSEITSKWTKDAPAKMSEADPRQDRVGPRCRRCRPLAGASCLCLISLTQSPPITSID